MRRAVAIACAVAVLFGIAYAGSPFLGYYRIQSAARNGDQDSLEAVIDFPAVRDNLKSQLNVAFAAKFQSDPKLRGNPFAGLGMMLATAVIGKLVDSYLTPEAISLMVSKAKTPNPANPKDVAHFADGKLDTRYSYINLDRFRVTAVNPRQADKPLAFVMERRGLFSWKLIRIELPPKLFE